MYPDKIAFCNAMKLIFQNARSYNPPSSDLCQMANKVEKYFHTVVPESILEAEAEKIKHEKEEAENGN